MSRYRGNRILRNRSNYYAPLRATRQKNEIRHYATPSMSNPSIPLRAAIPSVAHIWSYGDRLYQLAGQYYGDPEYWWVIAWYNAVPTEAHIHVSNVISIPIDLSEALQALGR